MDPLVAQVLASTNNKSEITSVAPCSTADRASEMCVENVTGLPADSSLELRPELAQWIYVMFTTACLTVAIFILVCNAIFVAACWQTRALRTLSTLYVISLAVSDMLQGVGMMLQALYYSDVMIGINLWHRYLCSWLHSIFLICLPVSIINIAFIAIDRYIYIIYPYRYPTVMTATKSKTAITIAWICSVALGLSIISNNQYRSGTKCKISSAVHTFYIWIRLVVFFSSVLVSGFCHISVQVVAMRHIRQVHARPAITLTRTEPASARSALSGTTVASLRLVKTFFLVYVSQLICWTPAVIVMTLNVPNGGLTNAVILLAELNAALNVLVYIFSNRQFRRAILDLLRYRRANRA